MKVRTPQMVRKSHQQRNRADQGGRKMPSQGRTRTCVGCRRKAQGEELIRFVGRDAELVPDLTWTQSGRGAHVCPSRQCVQLGVERGGFARTLRRRISVEDLGALITRLEAALHTQLLLTKAGLKRSGVLDDEEAGRAMPAWKRRLRVLESAVAAFAPTEQDSGQ